jgi:hypothetical protein
MQRNFAEVCNEIMHENVAKVCNDMFPFGGASSYLGPVVNGTGPVARRISRL